MDIRRQQQRGHRGAVRRGYAEDGLDDAVCGQQGRAADHAGGAARFRHGRQQRGHPAAEQHDPPDRTDEEGRRRHGGAGNHGGGHQRGDGGGGRRHRGRRRPARRGRLQRLQQQGRAEGFHGDFRRPVPDDEGHGRTVQVQHLERPVPDAHHHGRQVADRGRREELERAAGRPGERQGHRIRRIRRRDHDERGHRQRRNRHEQGRGAEETAGEPADPAAEKHPGQRGEGSEHAADRRAGERGQQRAELAEPRQRPDRRPGGKHGRARSGPV